jgi:hypothetical protein
MKKKCVPDIKNGYSTCSSSDKTRKKNGIFKGILKNGFFKKGTYKWKYYPDKCR